MTRLLGSPGIGKEVSVVGSESCWGLAYALSRDMYHTFFSLFGLGGSDVIFIGVTPTISADKILSCFRPLGLSYLPAEVT